uniref:Tudor domain containing 6 n=1 Tax=Cyprinus carpio TaxID=7962 RepID=A0A8C2PTD7_CYPCA
MCSIPGLPSMGSNVPVLITRLNLNPACVLVEFWGNFDQDRKFAYQQLKKEIQYPREGFCESDGNPGDLCLVRVYETWYRARIVSRDTDEYSVFLIDEGRTLRATVNTLAWGKSDFFYLPPEVEFCVLANVLPLSPENKWSAMALEFMKTFCGRRVNATVQDVLVPHRTFLLDIPCLSRQMFEMGFVKKLYSDRFKEFVARSLQANSGSGEPQRISSIRTKPIEIIEQMEKQQAYMYPELQTDTVETVVVTEVTSPFRIFCQLKVFSQELKKLTDQITRYYEGRVGCNFARLENLGSPCASRASDGKWYRSVLQQVMSANNVVGILQVDYGKKQFVQVENVRPLAPEFFRMPVVTYVCSLHGIADRGIGWTASQIDYLKSLLLNRTVIAKFQYQSLSEGVHYVTFYGEEAVFYRALPLRFQQLPAVAVKCSLYGIKPRLKHWDERATLFFLKLVEDRVLDLHVKEKHQDTHMVQLVDPSLDGENDVSKLLCNADFADSEKSFVDNSVTVSYIESPNDFWCQKARNAACLEVLMQDIQRFYGHSEFQPPLEAACVARHPETGIWYRALVIQKHQTPHVDVLFIDYGQTKKVAVEDLRKITPAFLKMKGQAFRCSLYNLIHPVSHSALDWSPEATLQFHEFVDTASSMNVPLKCTIFAVMYDSQKVVFNVVDLETPFQSICNLLVQKHLADRAPSKKAPLPPFRLDTYYYSTHGVKTGCEEEVSITCVKSVTQFFCHLARNSEEIEKLSNKVNSLCRQLEATKCPQTFGTVCFAKYTDGLWYRGQIKSTKPSVVVNFVDYGDTLEVDKSDLLPVPIEAGEIMSIPVQAIECGLSDMPEDVPCEVRNWFQNFADSHCFTALIVAKDPGGKLLVELYEGKTQVNALIRQKFHNEIHRNEPSAFKGYSSKNRSAQSGAIHMKESSSGLKRDFVHQVPQSRDSYAPQEGDVESKQPRSKLGFHTDGRQEPTRDFETLHNSQKQHEPQRKSNDRADVCHPCTSDKTDGVKPKSQALLNESALPVKVIKPGLEAEVFISHCNSPCSFFVQFATDEDGIYSLVEKLNADQSRCANIDPSDIREGDLVCAMFPEDNSWYRAAVRKNIGDTVNVEFVDFGNTATISVSKICHLDQSFAPFPRYSICCSVHKLNVESGDQKLAPNFKRVIEQNFEKVMCTFVEMSGTIWEVKLDINGVVLGSTCRGDATPAAELTAPGVKKTSDIKACTHYKNPDISAGQIITGYTSFIKGPQLFWCQYAATDKLQEISDALQNAGNASEKTLSEESLPVGSACIALFTEDNLWYRAKVTSRDHDSLSITFVDYGNEAKVNIGDVKALPPELSDVPPQAFDCQLEGFDLSKGFWAKEADDVFFELVHDKLLNITVEKMEISEMPHFVKLDCNGAVINKTMRSYWKSQSPETPSSLARVISPIIIHHTRSIICIYLKGNYLNRRLRNDT